MKKEEGVWRDYYTGSLVHEPPWLKDEPNALHCNGEESSNCAFQNNSWQDESCTANANVACACELKRRMLTLYLEESVQTLC